MRNTFNKELSCLFGEVADMGRLCTQAIALSVGILTEDNAALADEALEKSDEISRLERSIEGLCMKLILHQQPVASDLRRITSALRIISDMKRIGDQTLDIAEIAANNIGRRNGSEESIRKMAAVVSSMVSDCARAYIKNDPKLCNEVIKRDDEADSWFEKIKSEIAGFIADGGKSGGYYVDLIMIAKYLERIGDHCENISRRISYAITGEYGDR